MTLRLALAAALFAGSLRADGPRLDLHGDLLPEGAVARFGTTRFLPTAARHVVWSQDGRRLLTFSDDQAEVWSTATGRRLGILQRSGAFKGGCFLPNGKVVAAGTSPCGLLWDVDARTTQPLARDEPRAGFDVAASADGKTVALSLDDGTVLLLDPTTGRPHFRLRHLKDEKMISPLVFSGDGARVAGAADSWIFLWDVATGRRLRTWHAANERIYALAFAPDGRRLAVGGGGRLRLLEAESEEDIPGFAASPESQGIVALRFTPDGATLVAALDGGYLLRFDAATGKFLAAPRKGEQRAPVALDPSAGTVAVLGRQIVLYDTRTGKPRGGPEALPELVRVRFVRGDPATALCVSHGVLHAWEVATGRPVRTWPFEDSGDKIVPSPDGTHAAVVAKDDLSLALVQLKTGRAVWREAVMKDQKIEGISYSPDGQWVAFALRSGALHLRRAESGRPHPAMILGGEGEDAEIAWSADSRLLAVTQRTRWGVSLWEVATGLRRQSLSIGPARQAAFFADGRLAVRTEARGFLFSPESEKILAEGEPDERPTALAAAPNGRWLAIGDNEGLIHLLETSGPRRHLFAGHSGPVTDLTFSADGTRLASASEDGTALIWDLASLKPEAAPVPSAAATVAEAWQMLATLRADDAARALRQLQRRPDEATRLIAERLRPAASADAATVARWIGDLESGDYAARERASAALAALDHRAEAALRAALSRTQDAEKKRRLTGLVAALEAPLTDPEAVRAIRAIELLERLATAEARQILEALARGDAAARLTTEAKASLKRLALRPE